MWESWLLKNKPSAWAAGGHDILKKQSIKPRLDLYAIKYTAIPAVCGVKKSNLSISGRGAVVKRAVLLAELV